MKKLFFASALFVLVLAGIVPAKAADLVGPTKEDPNVNISTTATFENLYTAGATVNINGDTNGDLAAAGGLVTLVGTVEQDLLVAGGTLDLSGDIYGDARVLGGNISITSNIGGDLVLAGGNVVISEKAGIGGDLVLAGGNVSLSAPVAGNIKAAAGSLTINSKIDGNVYVIGSKNLTFGPNAEVLGKIVYKGQKPATVSAGAKVGAIEYTELARRDYKNKFRFLVSVGFLVQLVAWFLVGFILLRYRKNTVLQVAENIQAKPLSSLGWGLVFAVCGPVAISLLFVTIVGYYAAFLLGISYVLVLALSGVFAALSLGHMILKYLNKENKEIPDWQIALLGVVVFSLLRLVPVLGWIILAVLFLQVFGILVQLLKKEVFNR